MWMLLLACSGEPTEVPQPEPQPDPAPVPKDGRVEVVASQAPEDLLGKGWSVTLIEPTWDTTYTLQLKEHQGVIWCYESFASGKNVAMFRHGKSDFPPREDWIDHKDVADEILMPAGRLDGAVIHGYAWPSEAKDEGALKALSRKRAEAYEKWLRLAFADPLEASIEVRVEIPSRTYPSVTVEAHGADWTSWELDPEAQKVAGAQLVLREGSPDRSTVRQTELEDLDRFGRAVERLGNVARAPEGDNPVTLRVNAGDISYTAMKGSGSWEDVGEQVVAACGTRED